MFFNFFFLFMICYNVWGVFFYSNSAAKKHISMVLWLQWEKGIPHKENNARNHGVVSENIWLKHLTMKSVQKFWKKKYLAICKLGLYANFCVFAFIWTLLPSSLNQSIHTRCYSRIKQIWCNPQPPAFLSLKSGDTPAKNKNNSTIICLNLLLLVISPGIQH